VAVLLTEVTDVAAGGLEDRSPRRPIMATQVITVVAGGLRGGQHRLELQMLRPGVGDSAGTVGRRTYSAGERSTIPSVTQVRSNP
jgi:hypothetical protein